MSTDLPIAEPVDNPSRICCTCTRCHSCLPTVCPASISLSTVLRICFRLCLLVLFGICVFLVIYFWSFLSTFLLGVLNGLRELSVTHPFYSALILIGANVTAALLFLPCLPFTLATGFIFKTVRGTILVSIASTIASIVAFIIARYLARGLVERNLLGDKHSTMRVIDNAIGGKDGFRVVFLIRLSPIHPYSILNYGFGLTSVGLRDYAFASFFAMLPTSVMEVYSGAALSSIEDIKNGDTSAVSNVLLGVGLAVTVVVSIVITVWVRRKVKSEMDKYTPVSDDENEEVEVEEEEDQEVSSIRLDNISDEGELERDTPQHSASPTQGHVYAVGGERVYSSENGSSGGTAKGREESKEIPTTADLEAAPTDVSSAPNAAVVPIASPTQLRSRQPSPHASPFRAGTAAPSSSSAPVHITLRPAFSSSAPSLPPASLASPSLQSQSLLTRTLSSSSTGSSGGSSTGDGENLSLIKHS